MSYWWLWIVAVGIVWLTAAAWIVALWRIDARMERHAKEFQRRL